MDGRPPAPQSLMSNFIDKLAKVVEKDRRYAYEAYEFVFQALYHTQKLLGREPPSGSSEEELAADPKNHVSGQELLRGVCSLARKDFGLMAPAVFRQWGIRKTDDFGEIVFNLVEGELMSKTEEDTRNDFRNLFDLEEELLRDYRIEVLEAS